MHELSVARSLADFVCEQTVEMDQAHERVSLVRVRMGALCGIVPIALKNAFMSVIVGTTLQHCRLEIEPVDLVVFCPHCHREQTLGDIRQLICPVCGARTPRVVQGRELEIVSIEVIDAAQNLVQHTPDLGSAPAHP